jgi:nucleolar protein 12
MGCSITATKKKVNDLSAQMSLIDSIFGAASSSGEKSKKTSEPNPTSGSLVDLFSTTTELPDPPVYTYTASTRRSQQKDSVQKSKKRKISSPEEKKKSATTSSSSEQQPSQEQKEDKDARTVFVGNLPQTCSRKQLKHLFSDCGPIHSTRIRCVPLPAEDAAPKIKLPPALAGQQQVYKKVCVNTSASTSTVTKKVAVASSSSVVGYVVFVDAASVESALRKHNCLISDTTLEPPTSNEEGARHLRVDRVGGETQLRDPQRTVFLGNLPYRTDEETLHQHIVQQMAPQDGSSDMIESIRVVRDKETYLCKGFAYVLFASTQYVPMALRRLHQTTYMKQQLRVQVCGKRTKTSSKPKSGSTQSSLKGTTSPVAPSTAAVGALRRVLKKAKTALLPAPKANVRKRGPTASKAATATKKATPKKRPSTAQQRGKRLQHKIERHIQSQRRRPSKRG